MGILGVELFQRNGLAFGFRWLHVLAGIMWIGLLYYFNVVQVPAFAAYGDEAHARNVSLNVLARRALWWFRWAALSTLVLGLLITGSTENYFKNFMTGSSPTLAHDAAILVGMVLGITMAANVWMVIWKQQKVVLANAAAVLADQPADPGAPAAGRKALLASRQNFIFSVPMLFFMVGSAHFYNQLGFGALDSSGQAWTFVIVSLLIAAFLELSALGVIGGTAAGSPLNWPYENHRNAIISAFVLWGVLWILSEILLVA